MQVSRMHVISGFTSAALLLVTFCASHAAPLAYSGGGLSEDFNFPKLAKEPDAFSEPFPTAGLPGWDSDEADYIVMDGTTTTGALYSFGTLSSDDRALGSIASGGTGVVFYGLELRNDTSQSFSSFDLTYTGEQWRETTAGQNVLNFQYSLTATSVSSSLGYTGVSTLQRFILAVRREESTVMRQRIGQHSLIRSFSGTPLGVRERHCSFAGGTRTMRAVTRAWALTTSGSGPSLSRVRCYSAR